jgi:plastocyanin
MTQNDVMQLLIGKDIGAGPSVAAGNPVVDYSSLVDGEVAVVNSHNIVLSASSVLTDDIVAESGIKLVQRSGLNLLSSDMIKQNNILSYKGSTDAAGVEQISYIGYNGTSGAVEVVNSKLYVIRLGLKEKDQTGQGQEWIINAPYKSTAAATEHAIANGLALSLANAVNRQTVKPMKVELIANTAHAATGAFDNDTTVVNGEKMVTVGTNLEYDSAAGTLAVGDYVRFSATPAVTGSAVTDGIYKVTELVSTTQFNVDRPIEAASGSYTSSKAVATVLNTTKIAAADLGLRLTGIARAFEAGKFRYSKVEFEIGLDSSESFGDTGITLSQAMSLGTGTYGQIAELEWELEGNRGSEYQGDFMQPTPKADADSTAAYDQIGMTYFGDHPTSGVGATPRRPKQLILALATGFSNTEAPDIVVDVLDAYSTQDSGIGV